MAPLKRGKDGVLTVILALTLLVLIVCAGASVDVGRLASARTKVQNACDMSSLAGALACASDSDAQVWQTTAEYYRDNTARGSGKSVPLAFLSYISNPSISPTPCGAVYAVGTTTIRVTHPYRNRYTDSRGLQPANLVCVQADRNVNVPLLGAAGGAGSPLVRAQSVALIQQTREGKLAVFAHGANPEAQSFTWTGDGGTIDGWIHSNSSIDLVGSHHLCTKWIEYFNAKSEQGSDNQVSMGYKQKSPPATPKPYPVSLSISDFGEPNYVLTGHVEIPASEKVIPRGYYRIHGDLTITGSDHEADGVSFVVDGKIKVAVSNSVFKADKCNTLFLSLDSKSPLGIDLSASGGAFTGLCFAPKGTIRYCGSDGNTLDGALVGQDVIVTGSDFTVRGAALGWGDPRASLVQ